MLANLGARIPIFTLPQHHSEAGSNILRFIADRVSTSCLEASRINGKKARGKPGNKESLSTCESFIDQSNYQIRRFQLLMTNEKS